MKFLDKFEARYIDTYRLVLATCLVGAILIGLLLFSLFLRALANDETHSWRDYFDTPQWTQMRQSVLPLLVEQENIEAPPEKIEEEEQKVKIDQRVEAIWLNLAEQFERNEDGVDRFRLLVPRRILQNHLLEGSGVSAYFLNEYLEALISYSSDVGRDKRINRIASLEGRAETLMAALDVFTGVYKSNLDTAQSRVASEDEAEQQNIDEAWANFLTVGAAVLSLLVGAILIVVLLRVDVNLRKIANNLEDA